MKQPWLNCVMGLNLLKGGALLYVAASPVHALADEAEAQALLARYSTLEQRLNHNQFMRPVVLDSLELGDKVTGEIYVVTPHPFAAVSTGLNNPDHWCDVMSLHINTKYCRPVEAPGGVILDVYVGKKTPEHLHDAEQLEFNYLPAEQTPTYFATMLGSAEGPLGTRDYRIDLEAVPLPGDRTFLHLTYSYKTGFLSRLAIKTYLATIASGKVGFTSAGITADGKPRYIGGIRALMERNTMRFYLAIESFLAAANEPSAAQLDTRLQSWFSAVEEYPQLHELDRTQYLAMKHDEYLRQQTVD